MKTHPSTQIIHSEQVSSDNFAAFPQAIHQASTVLFEDVAAMRHSNWLDKSTYTYGLHGTPTSRALEKQLTEIEEGSHCLLAPSGLSAITIVSLALLKSGDDVLIAENAYHPNHEFALWLKEQYGISVRFYEPLIGAKIAQLIQPNTRLIWTEAPGSITMEVPDIEAICNAAHERQVVVALDNTWSAGLAFKPFAHGVDISMQALTKYQSGGSDVLMGSLVTRDLTLHNKLETVRRLLGLGVGMNDVYLILRSLATMPIRFIAHDAKARECALWLKNRPEIAAVLHPALPDCPGHENWLRDFSGAGGLFSVIFNERFTEAQTDKFVDSLQLFKIGYSWGGTHSLCVPYRMKSIRTNWQSKGQLVRFNIGLEDVADLLVDIEQALLKMQN